MTNSAKYSNIGWQQIIGFMFPYLMLTGLFAFVGCAFADVDLTNFDAPTSTNQTLIILIFNFIGNLVAILFFNNWELINLGFHLKNRFTDIVAGLIGGFLLMGSGFAFLLLLDEIEIQSIHVDIKEIMLSICIFLLISITEETLLRGYILRNLMISFNKYLSLVISSVLFGLLHAFNPNISWFSLLNLMVAGMVLGASYIYTKNLWFPIALHFSWNLFQSFFGFNVSGKNQYSIFESRFNNPNLLNGGLFGYEASILCFIALICAFMGIILFYEKKRKQCLTEAIQNMDLKMEQ